MKFCRQVHSGKPGKEKSNPLIKRVTTDSVRAWLHLEVVEKKLKKGPPPLVVLVVLLDELKLKIFFKRMIRSY